MFDKSTSYRALIPDVSRELRGGFLKSYGWTIVVFCILFVGGIGLPIQGTCYIVEFILPCVSLVFIVFNPEVRCKLREYAPAIFLGLLTIFVGFALDLFNRIDSAWLWRGLGRNLGTWLAFLAGIVILVRYGMERFTLFAAVVLLCIPLHLKLVNDPAAGDPQFLFKFYNGSFLILPLCYLVKKSRLFTVLLFFCFSGFLLFAADFRSGAAGFFGIALWLGIMPIMRRLKPMLVLLAFCALVPVTVFYSLWYSEVAPKYGDPVADRREMSDQIRREMAVDAIKGIRDRIWTGYGSWQHAVSFQSNLASDAPYEAVHSVPLQLGYEYGIFGLAFSTVVLAFVLGATTWISRFSQRLDVLSIMIVPQSLFWIMIALTNFFFGAIAGLGRISVGLSWAAVVWVAHLMLAFKRRVCVPPEYPVGHVGATERRVAMTLRR